MLSKNQLVSLSVTDLTNEGNGVARTGGIAVFVPLTAPGDEIVAKIVQVRKSYAYGILHELKKASPLRADSDCPIFARCGGCSLRHISYEAELSAKQGWVKESLKRIGGLEPSLEPIIASARERRYRNKAQYPVRLVEGRIRAGFFAPRSHRLIPTPKADCLLAPAHFADICRTVCAFAEEKAAPAYDEKSRSGLLRHIFIRWAEATGQTLVCLVLNGKGFPAEKELARRLKAVCPGISGVCVSENDSHSNAVMGSGARVISGSGQIEDVLCGVRLSLSPNSFYQVNRESAQLLYRAAAEYAGLKGGETVLDLYCGAGAIGLSMAGAAGRVIGVETVEAAVRNAVENAKANGIKNAQFLHADAAKAAALLRERGLSPDVVVLDPPRKGADEDTLRHIAAMSPARVVYASCNSATLARDCRVLEGLGYRAQRVRPVDLFPRAAHVECCCLLVKK